jgi:alkanesulfonate monooxygenase SsuD/methylene tetrahydromethanopterin reductase-like flavin-dependent oxidoreductase (luciferase family)
LTRWPGGCDEAGRDRSTLETSVLLTVLVDDNATPDQVRGERSGRVLAGSADHVAEQVQAKVLDAGVDGDALRPLVGLSA